MSINGIMRTGVSGMNAQANRLSTVSENIANANTNGYKRASTEFSSMILDSAKGEYNSGAVETQVRYSISQQGSTTFTSSPTDAAISGNGFFIVGDDAGGTFLTRAGSFVESQQFTANGGQLTTLQNAAGYRLYGSPIANGDIATADPNQRVLIQVDKNELRTAGTTQGALAMNFPALAEVNDEFNSSMVVYDTLGVARELQISVVNTEAAYPNASPPTGGTWSITVTDPVSGNTVNASVAFDPATGLPVAGSTAVLEDLDLGNNQLIDLDIGALTQFDSDFNAKVSADGYPPSRIETLEIGENGIVNGVLSDGTSVALYRLSLARVASPDMMEPLAGNVYLETVQSGERVYGFAGTSGFGEVIGSAVEGSNVDLAGELTDMIQAQRSYTASSKVFQTGSEILEVLVNLKR